MGISKTKYDSLEDYKAFETSESLCPMFRSNCLGAGTIDYDVDNKNKNKYKTEKLCQLWDVATSKCSLQR